MTESELWLCFRAFGGSRWERLVDRARAACLLDTAARGLAAGFTRAAVFTPTPSAFAGCGDVELVPTGAESPIGRIVAAAAVERDGRIACYAGSGMPGMLVEDWRGVLERASNGKAAVNNLFSTDFLIAPRAGLLAGVGGCAMDNEFGLALRDREGVEVEVLERSPRTLLDIDAPADLAVLGLAHEAGAMEIGPRLAAVLRDSAGELEEARGRLAAAFDVLTERERQFLAVGRVASGTWALLDRDTACRVRVIAEERGLRARTESGARARSLLGLHAEAVGPAALAEALAEVADGAVVDTRPLMAHLGWRPSRADRFASDAGDVEAIGHAGLRELSGGAVEARAPIALGGHSLVSGGLLAGIDIAWGRKEEREGIGRG